MQSLCITPIVCLMLHLFFVDAFTDNNKRQELKYDLSFFFDTLSQITPTHTNKAEKARDKRVSFFSLISIQIKWFGF